MTPINFRVSSYEYKSVWRLTGGDTLAPPHESFRHLARQAWIALGKTSRHSDEGVDNWIESVFNYCKRLYLQLYTHDTWDDWNVTQLRESSAQYCDELATHFLETGNLDAERTFREFAQKFLELSDPKGDFSAFRHSSSALGLSTRAGREAAVALWTRHWSLPEQVCTPEDLTETAFHQRDRAFVSQWVNGKLRLRNPQKSKRVQAVEDILRHNTPPVWHPAANKLRPMKRW